MVRLLAATRLLLERRNFLLATTLASRALASPPGRSRARRPELSNLPFARARWMHHRVDSMVSHDRSCV